jgi:hypothetical protein
MSPITQSRRRLSWIQAMSRRARSTGSAGRRLLRHRGVLHPIRRRLAQPALRCWFPAHSLAREGGLK